MVRVHKLVPREVWETRYEQINDFERTLAESGVIILKFFLHISKEEQQERLLDRERDSRKRGSSRWATGRSATTGTTIPRPMKTPWRAAAHLAPWHIVPADKKWYRNYIVARTIAERLEPYEHGWERTLTDMGKERRQELQAAQIPEREASVEANT